MLDIPKNRMAYPAIRVYIFGKDISDDVISISPSYNEGGAPNMVRIVLASENDRYITNTQDIFYFKYNVNFNLYPDDKQLNENTNKILNTEKWLNTKKINIPWMKEAKTFNIGDYVPDKVKYDILAKKYSASLPALSREDREKAFGSEIDDNTYLNYYGYDIKKYPISDSTCIFTPMDPVRIAVRDPFDATKWYWWFTGFVSDSVEMSDHNNNRQITIVAEDPLKLLHNTRIAINPGILDSKTLIDQKADVQVASFASNYLVGLKLPEIFYVTLFGPDTTGIKVGTKQKKDNPDSIFATKLRGIGHFAFDLSAIFEIGPKTQVFYQEPTAQAFYQAPIAPPLLVSENTVQQDTYSFNTSINYEETNKPIAGKKVIQLDNLNQWQYVLDTQVQQSDVWAMATEADRANDSIISGRLKYINSQATASILTTSGIDNYTQASVDSNILRVIDYIGTHPVEYPVDGGRLLMLVPTEFGVTRSEIVAKDIIGGYPLNSEFKNVAEILTDVVSRLDFVMYCSPKGDIIVEPPMYDFLPSDFGLDEMSDIGGVASMEYAPYHKHTDNDTPHRAFGFSFVIANEDTYSWEIALTDSKIVTMASCAVHPFQLWETLPDSNQWSAPDIVMKPDLVPIYGVRMATVPNRSYISSHKAAQLFLEMQINKINSDAHTLRTSVVPNMGMWINRPVYLEGRNIIGTTKQMGYSITFGTSGDMSMNIDLYAIRSWDGTVDSNGVPIYAPIGGRQSKFIDYAMLMQKAPLAEKTPKPADTSNKPPAPKNPAVVKKAK